LHFKGFDLITPNEKEARFADQDSGVRLLTTELRNKAEAECIILTLRERGAFYETDKTSFALESFAEQVVDPIGAGDALLAYATLAMLASDVGIETQATILGMIAAAIVCETEGNVPVTAEQMSGRIDHIERQMESWS
jgi:sugar/nucleoside kinase (ribokinase family)